MKTYITALGIILMLAGSGLAKEKNTKLSATDLAKRRAAIQNTTIIPGRSIGLIRLGMGMDEVDSVLGKPDFSYTVTLPGGSTVWTYGSINLKIDFNTGAAPSVTSITAKGWLFHDKTLGKLYWKDIEAPVVNYSTGAGVTLGSTSFAAIRAYAGNKYEDETFWVTFKGLGLQFLVSVDHIVYGIIVVAPE